jgi:hypothetical protein
MLIATYAKPMTGNERMAQLMGSALNGARWNGPEMAPKSGVSLTAKSKPCNEKARGYGLKLGGG